MPDTMVALATFAAFAIIYNFRFEQKGQTPRTSRIADGKRINYCLYHKAICTFTISCIFYLTNTGLH